MTAEQAIGPALGSYMVKAPGAQQPTIVPMVVTRADPNFPIHWQYLRQLKNNQGSPCPQGMTVCWGADGTPEALDYECCQPHEDCYVDPVSGDPACGLSQAVQDVFTKYQSQLGSSSFGPPSDIISYINAPPA